VIFYIRNKSNNRTSNKEHYATYCLSYVSYAAYLFTCIYEYVFNDICYCVSHIAALLHPRVYVCVCI